MDVEFFELPTEERAQLRKDFEELIDTLRQSKEQDGDTWCIEDEFKKYCAWYLRDTRQQRNQ